MNHTKKTAGRVEFRGFRGMDASRRRGDGTTGLLVRNFRFDRDGSLVKREGFAPLCTLPDTPRAAFACVESGKRILLFAIGAYLYRYDVATETLTNRQYFAYGSRPVCFFTMDGEIFVKEAGRLFRYIGNGYLETADMYVPLYGRNWTPEGDGELCEPVNLFLSDVRIHYALGGESVSELKVNVSVSQVIDVLWDDGTSTGVSGYYSPWDHTISLSSPLDLSHRHLMLVVSLDGYRSALTDFDNANYAMSFESGQYSRAVIYNENKFWCLAPVTPEMRRGAVLATGRDGRLYLPDGTGNSFGSGQPLRAVCRVHNSIGLFYEHGSWLSEDLAGKLMPTVSFAPLSEHLGCSAPEGAAAIGEGVPYAVNGRHVYRYDIDRKGQSDTVAVDLGCIDGIVDSAFGTGTRALVDYRHNELWFPEPGDGHRVVVYDLEKGYFSIFDGMDADMWLPLWDDVGFMKGKTVYCFSEDNLCDRPASGERAIVGEFLSSFCDFGSFEAYKRMGTLRVAADLGGGVLDVRIGDGSYLFETEAVGEAVETAPVEYIWRLSTRRFRQAQLRLLAPSPARQRILCAEMVLGQSQTK